MIGTFLGASIPGALLQVAGLTLLAGLVTGAVSFLYRVQVKAEIPDGVLVLIGLGIVALFLNTRLALVQFIGEDAQPLSLDNALWTLATFLLAGAASLGGARYGERLGESGRLSGRKVRPALSPIVRATGRFITVELPHEIETIEGYDAVPDETRANLEGASMDFPKGLTLEELRTQLVARLKEEHAVGYVDVDLTEEGDVEHLAIGQRAIGLGPALPPGFTALAVRSDPPLSATPGDAVQIWRPGDGETGPERVGRGELRASTESVATIATKPQTARKISIQDEYRLVTTATGSNADREFASMLRRSDETLGVFELSEESSLIGVSIRALDLTVIAIQAAEGTIETLPPASRSIQAGDRLYALGKPESLRKLQTARGCSQQSL